MWSETWENYVEQIRFYVVHSRLYPILTMKTFEMFQILGDVVLEFTQQSYFTKQNCLITGGGEDFPFPNTLHCFCWCDFFWSCVMMTCLPIKKTGSQPIESKPPKIDFFESMCREVCWFRLHTSGDLTHQFSRLIIWVVSLHRFFVASWSFTLQGTRKTQAHQMAFSRKIIDSKWWYGLVRRRGRWRSPPTKS